MPPGPEDVELDSSEDDLTRTGGHKRPSESPSKSRRGSSAVSEDLLRSLLADTQAAILKNHTDTIQAAVASLEAKSSERFKGLESKLSVQETRQEGVEGALKELQGRVRALEEGSTSAGSESGDRSGLEQRRKLTLVIGGFERDTKRHFILERVKGMLSRLDVKSDLDEEPFVTGPRRSSALLPFRLRPGESLADAKGRMHRVLGAIIRAKEPIPGRDKPMWSGVSKSPAEREVAGHCTWMRGVCRLLQPSMVDELEHDYNTGTTWAGQSKVACYSSPPPQIDSYKLHLWAKSHAQGKAWVDLSALSKEMKTTLDDVEGVITRFMN